MYYRYMIIQVYWVALNLKNKDRHFIRTTVRDSVLILACIDSNFVENLNF